ncbi:hypothetical protein EE612_045019 [Oryza sativa]|nr:hypothetical protein EE612_045019 [Oryza sativa]
MPSSPWIPTAGAPPPRAAPAVVYSWLSERHPVKEAGAGAGASNAQESRPRVSPAENSEVETREHEEKVNKYQAVLAARLKAKYFSGKAFGKGTSALQSYDNSMAWHIMVYRRFACLFRQSDICLVRLSFFF